MTIPNIIHQTWKESGLPPQFKAYSDSWQKQHPTWRHQLWSDADNRQLIHDYFPWFLRFYDNYSLDIQRADAARYFILYKYGGLYADLDIECIRPVDGLLSGKSCVLGTEPASHCNIHGVDKIISNAFMAVTPGHDFFYTILKEMITYTPKSKQADRFVLETTGPFMLNRVYAKYPHQDRISLLPANCLSPLDYMESEKYLTQPDSRTYHDRLAGAYGIHYYLGTWWKKASQLRPLPEQSSDNK